MLLRTVIAGTRLPALVQPFSTRPVHHPRLTERAGGKGANVVRTLHRHQKSATLVTALGGVQGDAFRALAPREVLTVVGISVQAPTRVCTTVLDRHGASSF